ncbi:MAG: hypothetical protein OES57_12430, partial [Acidimicrobiia bacterium]|nr:hypothetical protein [Acidimicrobiia bacterium]
CALAAACVPTIDETISIDADGSGQFTAAWFVTRDDFDDVGSPDDAENALGNLEWTEVQDRFRASRPEELIAQLTGNPDYRPPRRATLVSQVDDDRIGIVYRESFSSLRQLEAWRRDGGPAGTFAGPADPGSGRLSLLGLWGLDVTESPDQTSLTIEPASAFAVNPLAGIGDDQPVDAFRLRLAISVEGEVVDSNADRVEGDLYVWEPSVDGLSVDQIDALEPVRLTWRWTPEPEEESQTTTIAFVLIGAGALIALLAFLRFLWSRRLTRPRYYDDG